jgi:hypothetical protein
VWKREKEGKSDGTGGRRVGTPRKKRREGVHQVMCAREEREGVTGGAAGGQRRGRMEGKTREEEGRTW